MPRKPLALAAALLFVLLVPSAHAAIVPGQVIDGPSSDIQRFGDIDLAPDGTGALTYVKAVGGNNNIFVSTFNGSAWGPGQQVSNGTLCPAQFSCSDPHVAAGNGGRVVVTFVANASAGAGNLEAALKPNAASPFQLAQAAPGSNGEIQGDDVDMDPSSGVAYAVMDQIANVRASRLSGTTWTEVLGSGSAGNISGANNDTPLNLGAGNQNTARVAVDSAGDAVVAWPGQDSGGKGQVFARRLVGTTAPQPSVTMSIPSLAGMPADGNNANMITMDGGGSANPWIAFREQFTYPGPVGRVRDLAAQLVGNTATAAQPLDGLPLDTPTEGAEFPRIAINPAGKGLAGTSRQLTFQAFGSSLTGGLWTTGSRLDSGTPASQQFAGAAIDDLGDGLFAWADTSGSTSQVVSRQDVGGTLGAPVTLSRSSDGPILPTTDFAVGLSSSAAGTVGVAFGQGNGTTTNEIVAAVVDLPRPPGGGGGNPDKTPPVISKLKLSDTRFRLGSQLASFSRKRTPVGTTISFSVSEQSKVTFTFARKTKGFKSGKRCVAHRPKGKKHAKRCTRFVNAKPSLSFAASAGAHKLEFEGRLDRRHKLRPGRYRLTLTATDAAGNKSKPRTASFTLLKK